MKNNGDITITLLPPTEPSDMLKRARAYMEPKPRFDNQMIVFGIATAFMFGLCAFWAYLIFLKYGW